VFAVEAIMAIDFGVVNPLGVTATGTLGGGTPKFTNPLSFSMPSVENNSQIRCFKQHVLSP
jgi:hypothetical protein